LSGEVFERLARYERILRQNGLLDSDDVLGEDNTDFASETGAPGQTDPSTAARLKANTGRLMADQNKSRFINSNLWSNFGEQGLYRLSDDEEEEAGMEEAEAIGSTVGTPDPLTEALIGHQRQLLAYHPSHEQAMVLWQAYAENVEPICRILHIPSTFDMVHKVSQHPEKASKSEECILFAVYHFAVFSMAEEDCIGKTGMHRKTLLQQFQSAAKTALVNASFLRTTELAVLQALVLFLIPCRYIYDPHTYWILTGVAVRIAQRLGLHRDGQELDLPPFEVEMRRRLFYQVLPLDGIASQLSGTGVSAIPEDWTTQQPLNINDDQIWPGMTSRPQEQTGATEMIFCLSRSCLGKSILKVGKPMNSPAAWHFGDHDEIERVIRTAESEVEEKYIRYCDIVNPLHLLANSAVRAGITAMRLRVQLSKIRDQPVTDEDRRKALALAQKILDTDTAIYAHPSLRKYQWHVRSFFLWGSWDSLMFILTSLSKTPDLLSPVEVATAWKQLTQIYSNHHELLTSKRALYVAFQRLTLEAWEVCSSKTNLLEPRFVKELQASKEVEVSTDTKILDNSMNKWTMGEREKSPASLRFPNNAENWSNDFVQNLGLEDENDFHADAADWLYWNPIGVEDPALENP
jgi:hypothetical protein